MNHPQEEQLTSYLLGELEPALAEQVRKHLETCEDCRALSRELESTLDLLRGALAADASAPEFLDASHKRRIAAAKRSAPVIWLAEHRGALMQAAAVVAVLFFIGRFMLLPAMKKDRYDMDEVAPREQTAVAKPVALDGEISQSEVLGKTEVMKGAEVADKLSLDEARLGAGGRQELKQKKVGAFGGGKALPELAGASKTDLSDQSYRSDLPASAPAAAPPPARAKDAGDLRDDKNAKEANVAAVFHALEPTGYDSAADKPLSTFALDVDTASYTIARKYMLAGSLPPPAAIRTEEFINFFDYRYEPPANGAFAVTVDSSPTPFLSGSTLRIGVKARAIGRDTQKPVVLTLVVDTSGSMDTPDRLGLVRQSVRLLVDQLHPSDRVAIVQYDSEARLVLESTPATEKDRILAAIDGLQTSGSTHLDLGLKLGYDIAARGFVTGSVNRVLLLSDGVANLGTDKPEEILRSIEDQKARGIFLSVFGFGLGTYNDPMLETLADKGDGAYEFIDSPDEARRLFIEQFAATLHVVAKDVKIQVEFDPARVKQYRQIGYDNRQLAAQDFRNDAVDAGEAGSGQSVTALYNVELQGDATRPIGTVRIRYLDVDSGMRQEIEQPIPAPDSTADFERAGAAFRLAASVAAFAEKLRGTPWSANYEFDDIAKELRPVSMEWSDDARVQELLRLVNTAGSLPRAQ